MITLITLITLLLNDPPDHQLPGMMEKLLSENIKMSLQSPRSDRKPCFMSTVSEKPLPPEDSNECDKEHKMAATQEIFSLMHI